jgi:hypothetical protein
VLAPPTGRSAAGLQCCGECFLLTFRGVDVPVLKQDTYGFNHAVMGRFAMLIVPVNNGGIRPDCYQAVFNRAVPVGSPFAVGTGVTNDTPLQRTR